MAKSKIIKDLANSNIDTITALKRAKVLFSELGNEKLLNWVNFEISGYPLDADLPSYRIEQGSLMGSYMKGSMASHMKWTNVSIPLGKMPEDIKKEMLSIKFSEGVEALKQLADEYSTGDKKLGKVIPADLFPAIATFNNDPYMIITSAHVTVATHSIYNIFSMIESKLLDTLLLLEKEFGNLDELDLDIASKSPEELSQISDKITVIIYNDYSVNVGDNNTLKNSVIGQQSND